MVDEWETVQAKASHI